MGVKLGGCGYLSVSSIFLFCPGDGVCTGGEEGGCGVIGDGAPDGFCDVLGGGGGIGGGFPVGEDFLDLGEVGWWEVEHALAGIVAEAGVWCTAGEDEGGPDVELGELEGEGLGEGVYSGLAGGVDGEEEEGAEGDGGGDVDDGAGFFLAEVGEEGLGDGHGAEGIGLENFADAVDGGAFEGIEEADACIVHEGVYGASGLDEGVDALGVGDIEREDAEVLGAGQDGGVWHAHGGDDLPPASEEVGGDFEAKA